MADPASHTALMSWMMEELKENKLRREERQGKTNQMTLLPEPAKRIGVYKTSLPEIITKTKLTFSVYPQEGTCRLPLDDNLALKEPRCRSVVLSFLCNVVICGRIGGREPGS